MERVIAHPLAHKIEKPTCKLLGSQSHAFEPRLDGKVGAIAWSAISNCEFFVLDGSGDLYRHNLYTSATQFVAHTGIVNDDSWRFSGMWLLQNDQAIAVVCDTTPNKAETEDDVCHLYIFSLLTGQTTVRKVVARSDHRTIKTKIWYDPTNCQRTILCVINILDNTLTVCEVVVTSSSTVYNILRKRHSLGTTPPSFDFSSQLSASLPCLYFTSNKAVHGFFDITSLWQKANRFSEQQFWSAPDDPGRWFHDTDPHSCFPTAVACSLHKGRDEVCFVTNTGMLYLFNPDCCVDPSSELESGSSSSTCFTAVIDLLKFAPPAVLSTTFVLTCTGDGSSVLVRGYDANCVKLVNYIFDLHTNKLSCKQSARKHLPANCLSSGNGSVMGMYNCERSFFFGTGKTDFIDTRDDSSIRMLSADSDYVIAQGATPNGRVLYYFMADIFRHTHMQLFLCGAHDQLSWEHAIHAATTTPQFRSSVLATVALAPLTVALLPPELCKYIAELMFVSANFCV